MKWIPFFSGSTLHCDKVGLSAGRVREQERERVAIHNEY